VQLLFFMTSLANVNWFSIILSLLHSDKNCWRSWNKSYHLASNMLPHCFAKFDCSSVGLQLRTKYKVLRILKTYMRGIDRFRHEGRVISHFSRSAHKTLGNVAKMKAWLNAQSLFRHQRLADWWVAFRWTVFQLTMISAEHKPHAARTSTFQHQWRRRRRRNRKKGEKRRKSTIISTLNVKNTKRIKKEAQKVSLS